ncbi:MAG TPA: hypothetical protein VFL03_00025, partial [Candidatus Limnocylindrales bacterium]|nr:hypothetical protein [Candidatus Limnocylindrales bacterium]
LVLTAAWAWILLARTPDFFPEAGMWALVITVAAAVVLAVALAIGRGPTMLPRAALVVGVAAVLLGPVLYAGATMSRAIAGGDPAPGPVDGRFAGRLGGGFGGFGGPDGSAASAEVIDYLVANRGDATWLVAATSAGEAAPIQLQTGVPVMAMGGFSGSDAAPTLEELQGHVRDGSLRFVLLWGIGGGPGVNLGGGLGRFGQGGQRPADGPDDVGGAGGRGSGPVGGPDAGPAGFGAPGGFGGFGGGEVARERTEWVMESCAPVSIGGQQTGLFDCAGAGD